MEVVGVAVMVCMAAMLNQVNGHEEEEADDRSAPVSMQAPTTSRTWYISERETILIESPGFGSSGGYPRGTTCTWRIYNNRCNLVMNCPKFRLSDLLCFDYMEIQDYHGWSRRHCGLQRPTGLNLGRFTTITFSSSNLLKFPLTGFRCRIQCEANEKTAVKVVVTTTAPSPEKVQPRNCTCGVGYNNRKSKIINGTVAYTGEFPWVVALIANDHDEPFCGGALISNKYILTAAHCVQGSQRPRFRVLLNYDPEIVTILGSGRTIRLSVDRVIVHPKYNSLRLDYDAALIKLVDTFELSDATYTVPVCLPTMQDRLRNFAHENATVIGWGATSVDQALAEVPEGANRRRLVPLHKVNLSVLPDRKCQEVYLDRKIKPEKLCAYSAFQDSCAGDSGGPLMLRKNNSAHGSSALVQIGIVSSGSGCAQVDTPGIYTRTSEILTWISINTRDSIYCAK